MNDFERNLLHRLEHNASVFLKEGFSKVIDDESTNTDSFDYDSMLIAVSEIQTSLEIALKAYLLSKKGIRYILDRKQQTLTDDQIEVEYSKNNLKVLEFEGLKNQLKGLRDVDFEKKVEFKQIEQYQLYRNRIMHFSLALDERDLSGMKDDLLYYVIHIVMYLLYDHYKNQKPNEFFEELLGYDFYDKLSKYPSFTKAMENMASRDGKKAWLCPICSNWTFSPEDRYCYCCNYEAHEFFVHWYNCNQCGRKDSVIYDFNAPYAKYPHVYEGKCLACEEQQAIFECPQCGSRHHFFMNAGLFHCSEENCINISK